MSVDFHTICFWQRQESAFTPSVYALTGVFAANGYVAIRESVEIRCRIGRRTIEDIQRPRNQSIGGFWPLHQPFLVLKMSEFFRESYIDELVERDSFFL
jgi:hypothetical protein